MTKARSNAVAEAAKGDLSVGSGTNLAGILAVGNNGETLVADSSTSTGLRYQVPVNVNPVLNSAFQIAQRGTSVSAPAANNTYTLDRWLASTGASAAATVSRQTTSDTTNLPFIQYCARVQRNSGQTGTVIWFLQSMETINSIPFAGKTVTVSFYARKGADYSAASSVLNLKLVSGTGTDQNLATGYTGSANVIDTNATLTTTWQRFTATGTVGATATELTTQFVFTASGTAGSNDYYEVTGVQVEVGSVATPFKTYAGTIQGELAACQRYYIRTTGNNSSALLGTLGFAKSTSLAVMPFALPVTMRTAVSAIDTGGTPQIADGNTGYSGGTWALDTSSSTSCTVTYTHGSASLTQYRPYFPQATTGTSYIGFSAEL